MITGLGLENFKAWRKLDKIRMAPLTGFFGANSSGKSSIIQFLLMLKQTASYSDPRTVLYFGDDRNPESSLVELGSYEAIVFQHERANSISWKLEWRIPSIGENPSLYEMQTEVQADAQGSPRVTSIFYRFEDSAYEVRKVSDVPEYAIFHDKQKRDVPKRYRGNSIVDKIGDLPTRFFGFPENLSDELIHRFLEHALEAQFQEIYYLGPIREFPRRIYSWSGGVPSDVGKMGQRFVDAILTSRLRDTKEFAELDDPERGLEEKTARRLKTLNLIHDFKMERIGASNLYQAMVQQKPHSVFVPLPDVGFGVSQILPVLVLCFYAPEHSTIILEHPELHLHPSAQMGLADVLIEAIQKRHIQIILESHSEHLLNRIQRRMAEASLTKEEVALYFCDMEEDGAAKMEELKLNEYGEISNYPPDFFGNQFEEVAETQLAGLRRRKANQ